MEQVDSRRLTGANILWSRPGAVLDVRFGAGEDEERAIEAWRSEVVAIARALGFDGNTAVRRFAGGANLALAAPIDALYVATEINETALARADARMRGEHPGAPESVLDGLAERVRAEANPALIAVQQAAHARGVALLHDDDEVTVGLGSGSSTWPARELPQPHDIDWSSVHDVPTALVTGTNGKSTTSRLLAAIAGAAGLVPGLSSTDWVRVGDDVLDRGDWSGPGGARLVLRDRRTTVGVLETARGGMLRRGLALESATVAAVLNVAADHLGEWGVGSLDGLADTKFVVAHAARTLVLNADDEIVARRGRALERGGQRIVWYTLEPKRPALREHLAAGRPAALYEDGELLLVRDGVRTRIARADEVPITLGGAARYNIGNALAAAALARELGIDDAAIRAGLRAFGTREGENPGRLEHFVVNGARVLVDFAHNPHGTDAILETAHAMRGERTLVLIGQAGDRDDEAIRELARATWRARPELIVVKEMPEHLRGRAAGEVSALLVAELRAAGAPERRIHVAPDELTAFGFALDWAQPGDVLVLLAHAQRDEALALVRARV